MALKPATCITNPYFATNKHLTQNTTLPADYSLPQNKVKTMQNPKSQADDHATSLPWLWLSLRIIKRLLRMLKGKFVMLFISLFGDSCSSAIKSHDSTPYSIFQ